MMMLKVSEVRFNKLEKKDNKYNIVPLYYWNSDRIFLSLPKFYCPFGITKYISNSNHEKYSLNLSIDNNLIYRFLNNLDDLVIDNFIENEEWLDILNISVNSNKKRIAKYSNKLLNEKPNFLPYINLKLIHDDDGNFFTDIKFYKNRKYKKIKNIKQIESLLYKKCYIKTQIVISNVWIMDKSFGITIKPKTIVIYEK